MFLFLLLFIAYIGWLAARVARASLVDWLLTSFLLFAGSVIFTGFVLSALYLTNHEWVWAVAVFVTASLIGFTLRWLAGQPTPFSIRQLLGNRRREAGGWFTSLPLYGKVLYGGLLLTLAVLALTNLSIVLFTVPNEWDSMTGHLNRVVQYMQRGSMRHFGGTNWNIDTYPKSVCTLQIYGYLLTGRVENGFKLIHHLSYWMVLVAVFGISQRIGQLRSADQPRPVQVSGEASRTHLSASFLVALCMALLPDFLMQAVTTETDIVLTAYLSTLLYCLFSYRLTRDNRYLYGAGMAFGIAYGHKITFTLLLPSVFVIMVYTVFWANSFRVTWGRTWRLGAAIAVGVCLWMLPTGYLKNIEVFGHPIGPPTALRHQSVERAGSLRNLFEQGSRNVIRYGYDMVNLDGLRNLEPGANLNRTMRLPLVWLEDRLHLRLDDETDFSIIPFAFERRFVFTNANPYWGVIGFGLVLPLVVLVLLFVLRSPPHVALGLAVGLHWMALAYSAPYDPFKGRYFTETGMMAAPFLALLILHPRLNLLAPDRATFGRVLLKSYVGLVLALGAVSALCCVFFNIRALPFAWTTPDGHRFPSVFEADRVRVMTIGRSDIYVPYKRFDDLVPDTATVALGTINDDYEYPLYGKNLSRRLIQINPFERGVQPIPNQATYLFFSKNVIEPRPGDIRLGTDTTARNSPYVVVPGEDYYLRKLR